MKTIKTLLLLSLSIILFSCDDGNNKNDELISLKQTSWKGDFIQVKAGKEIKKGNIGIEFTTGEYGMFSLIFEDAPSTDHVGRFEYTSEKKLLVIDPGAGYDSILAGNWFIVSNKKNTLILQKGTSNEGGEKSTITLKKVL